MRSKSRKNLDSIIRQHWHTI